jgi:hypothetical protein
MRRFALLGALSAGLVLTGAPAGLAGSGSFSDPRNDLDPKAASDSARYDIVRATVGHARGRRLVHTVSVAGGIANPASAEVPLLYIEDTAADAPNGTSTCRYFVGRHEGRLGVFTCGYGDRVASARIRRTSSSTVRYEFKEKAIGSPDSYRWAFVTRGPTDGTTSILDRLPSGDNFAFHTHALR